MSYVKQKQTITTGMIIGFTDSGWPIIQINIQPHCSHPALMSDTAQVGDEVEVHIGGSDTTEDGSYFEADLLPDDK